VPYYIYYIQSLLEDFWEFSAVQSAQRLPSRRQTRAHLYTSATH